MKKSTLEEYLEKWVFDEGKLKELKQQLKKQIDENLSEKVILTMILNYLASIYENLCDFIPFYFDNIITKQEIQSFSEKIYTSQEKTDAIQIRDQLREREEFLKQIAKRIQQISQNVE
ncbi:MAG: hypothetical protein EU543_02115 [Promethearchaeota archaeon]|nr:MAG: hypothetical protein EU543_02115 [Candidatus Lokiarchaeota archaeon]